MSDLSEYQQLIENFPKLENQEHREAFDEFVARMWAKPTSFKHYLRAYLEFSAPEKLTFRRLDDMRNEIPPVGAPVNQPGGQRSGGRRSRSRRRGNN